jgi:hypothetical protein
MKHFSLSVCKLLAMTFFCHTALAQNVLTKAPSVLNTLPAASPEVFRVQNGLLAHRVAGNIGQFTGTDQWIGIGAPLSSLYGERTQWNGQAFIKALRSQNPAVPSATKDAILEWGNQGGEMQFRYVFDPALPSSFFRILTLQSNANAYFGSSAPGTLAGTPKLGVNTAKQTGLTVQTVRATAGEFLTNADENFSTATGVIGFVKSSGANTSNFGVQGRVELNPFGSANYGVYGSVPGNIDDEVSRGSGNFAVFGTCPIGFNSYAGFFQGDVFSTGLYLGSDQKLKSNVATEGNAMELLRQLRPVTYGYNTAEHKALNLPTVKQHGLIAQEVQAVLPELVKASRYTVMDEKGKPSLSDEFLSINYQGLIPLLIKAIQEQQQEIDALKAAQANSNIDAGTADRAIATKGGVFKANQFVLEQNVPNPFSGNTTIRYALPKGVANASLAVFDLTGKMQLQYNNLNGSSQVTINGNTLAAGMYIYTLLADGQEVVSKRMILTK